MITESTGERLQPFVDYAQRLKGEAQVFCDRLFQAFGHAGYKETGATLEDRQHRHGKNVKFIDLIWKPRLILEMKSRHHDLRDHYQQAFEYWLHSVPRRPKYVVLWAISTILDLRVRRTTRRANWTACDWLICPSVMML